MTISEQIEKDLKTAMLAGEKTKVTVLRGLKSAIQYAEVAKNSGKLSEDEILVVLQKESKKRTEAADLYAKNGADEQANAEKAEQAIIAEYLPAQMDESEIVKIIDGVIADTGADSMQMMGQVIGQVKSKTGASADGSLIAQLVKTRLQEK